MRMWSPRYICNNMGIKPAGSIAKTALDLSADKFKEIYPATSQQLKDSSYVDDLGVTDKQLDSLKERTNEAVKILADAGMKVHKWIYSREDMETDSVEWGNLAEDEIELERVLGIKWNPGREVFKFVVSINLHPIKKKARSGPPLTKEELMMSPPAVIT